MFYGGIKVYVATYIITIVWISTTMMNLKLRMDDGNTNNIIT